MLQYPDGALCMEQIRQLLIATHERRVVVYAFNYSINEDKFFISPVELSTSSRISSDGNTHNVKWLTSKDLKLDLLATNSRCQPRSKDNDVDRGWVFGNYWFAYAYGLRLKDAHEKVSA